MNEVYTQLLSLGRADRSLRHDENPESAAMMQLQALAMDGPETDSWPLHLPYRYQIQIYRISLSQKFYWSSRYWLEMKHKKCSVHMRVMIEPPVGT